MRVLGPDPVRAPIVRMRANQRSDLHQPRPDEGVGLHPGQPILRRRLGPCLLRRLPDRRFIGTPALRRINRFIAEESPTGLDLHYGLLNSAAVALAGQTRGTLVPAITGTLELTLRSGGIGNA